MSIKTANPSRNGTGVSNRGGLLDFLRFAASLLIVVYHFSSEGPVALDTVSPIFLRGYLATDFFLILSGYVLGRSYGPKLARGGIQAGGFMLRRICRVWPGHLVMLGAFAAVIVVSGLLGVSPHHADRFVWSALPMQVFLVQSWGMVGGGGWNLPTWSLSALLVCYAAFPMLWRGLRRITLGAGLLLIGLAGLLLANGLASAWFGRPLYDLPYQEGAIRALPLFCLGACLARAVELSWPSEAWARFLGLSAGAAFLGLQIAGRYDSASLVCIALIVLAAGRIAVRKPSRLIEAGARLSFALFLSHAFTGMLWFTLVKAVEARVSLDQPALWGLWALAFPFSLAGAWLFDRYVDQPLQAWITPRMKALRLPIPRLA